MNTRRSRRHVIFGFSSSATESCRIQPPPCIITINSRSLASHRHSSTPCGWLLDNTREAPLGFRDDRHKYNHLLVSCNSSLARAPLDVALVQFQARFLGSMAILVRKSASWRDIVSPRRASQAFLRAPLHRTSSAESALNIAHNYHSAAPGTKWTCNYSSVTVCQVCEPGA